MVSPSLQTIEHLINGVDSFHVIGHENSLTGRKVVIYVQNVVPVIQAAAPVESVIPSAKSSGNQSLADLFANLLQQFQANSAPGKEPSVEEGSTELSQATVLPENAIVIANQAEGIDTALVSKQAMLETLEGLDLPETIDLNEVIAVIEKAFGPHVSEAVVAKVNELVKQGMSPEVLAKLQALVSDEITPKVEGTIPLVKTTEVIAQAVEPILPAEHVAKTKGEQPLVQATVTTKTPTTPIDLPIREGGAEAGIPAELESAKVKVPEVLSRAEVSTDGKPQGIPHRVDAPELQARSVAPEVLAQLKEVGVKGITDEKVARVSEATQKSLNPEVAIAVSEAKPKENTVAFAPPKVAPLSTVSNATPQGQEVPKAVPEAPVEQAEVSKAKPFMANWKVPTENAVSNEAQASVVTSILPGMQESVAAIKPVVEVPAFVQGAVAIPIAESSETQALAQELTSKTPEAPTLRTAGDFTIRSVRHLLGSGEETIEIKLHPQSLGSLNVAVKTTGESVEIIVTAASPMVREMLEVQLAGLKETLMNDGVDVTKVRVESNGTSQNDMSQLASQQQSTSSQGTNKNQQGQQANAGMYQEDGMEANGSDAQASKPSAHHEGEINLFA